MMGNLSSKWFRPLVATFLLSSMLTITGCEQNGDGDDNNTAGTGSDINTTVVDDNITVDLTPEQLEALSLESMTAPAAFSATYGKNENNTSAITYTDYLGGNRTAPEANQSEVVSGTGYAHTVFDSADNKCQNCHNELYDTWKSSMHGQSWKDQVFQSKFQDFLRTHLAKLGKAATVGEDGEADGDNTIGDDTIAYSEQKFKGVAQTCIKCHAPTAYYSGDVKVTLDVLKASDVTTTDLNVARANFEINAKTSATTSTDVDAPISVVGLSADGKLYRATFHIGHENNREGINCAFCHSIETVRMMDDGTDGKGDAGDYTLKDAIRVGPIGPIKAASADTLTYNVDPTDPGMNKFFRLWGPEKYTGYKTPKTPTAYDVNKSKDGRYTMASVDLNGTDGKVHYTGGPFYGPFGTSGKGNENPADESNRTALIHPDFDKDTNNHFGDKGKALCLACHQRSAGAFDKTGGAFMELCSTWNAVTTGSDTNDNDSLTSPKCQKCHMERIEGKLLHSYAAPEGNITAQAFLESAGYALTPELDFNDTTVAAGENPQRDGWFNSHGFLGAAKNGHKTSVVAKIQSGFTATVDSNTSGTNATVTATLANKTAHMFPGAHPMRRVLTRIIVTDDANNSIAWSSATGDSAFADFEYNVTTLADFNLSAYQDATVVVDDAGNDALSFPGKTDDLNGSSVDSQKFDGTPVIVTAPDGTVKSQFIEGGKIKGTVKNAAIVASTDMTNFTRIYGHETGKKYDHDNNASTDPIFVVRPGFDSSLVGGDTRLSPNETETYTLNYTGLSAGDYTVTYKVYYMQKGAGGSFPTTADGWLNATVNAEKKILISGVHSSTSTFTVTE